MRRTTPIGLAIIVAIVASLVVNAMIANPVFAGYLIVCVLLALMFFIALVS